MKIRKQFSKKYKGTPWKGKPGKSITVPDQNLTISELLDRHSRGVSLGAPEIKGEYFDTEVPRFDDLTDAMEYKKNLDRKAKDLEEQIKQQTHAKIKSQTAKPEDVVSEAETVAKATKNQTPV